jgi:hypothetical protein
MTEIPKLSTRPVIKNRITEMAVLGLIIRVTYDSKQKPLAMPDFLPALLHLRSAGYQLDVFSAEGLDGNEIYRLLDLLESEGLVSKEKPPADRCSGARYFFAPALGLDDFLTAEIVGSEELETMAAELLCAL